VRADHEGLLDVGAAARPGLQRRERPRAEAPVGGEQVAEAAEDLLGAHDADVQRRDEPRCPPRAGAEDDRAGRRDRGRAAGHGRVERPDARAIVRDGVVA
jgi:hypothetical protein